MTLRLLRVSLVNAGRRRVSIENPIPSENMCRNIKTLYNFDPPATDEEIRASALQFVRKLSGFTKPSKANEEAFDRAVTDVAAVARELIDSLTTKAAPKNREVEKQKLMERSAKRFGKPVPTATS